MEQLKLNDIARESSELKNEIMSAVEKVLEHSKFIFGSEVEEFEKEFASYCGTKYCLGISNGTDALILALRGLGIGKGDEVITTTMSFVATAAAIAHTGATPVFVDVLPNTLSIDVTAVEKVITKNTKAILPVHLYGVPADMDALLAICKKHNLYLVEDCAQSQGAEYKGKKTGSFGDVGCFSFMPSKNLGALGDAGGIVTNREDVYKKIKNLYNHGRDDNGYTHTNIGFTNRLDSLHAAILSLKLKYLNKRNEKRREIAGKYDQAFADSKIEFLRLPQDTAPCYYVYPIFVNNRDELIKQMSVSKIDTGVHYPLPVHLQPSFKYLGYKEGDFPVVEAYAKKVLSIPMHPFLKDDEIDYIVKKVLEFSV